MKSNRFLAGITASVLLMTATFTELPFCNPLPSAAVDTDVSLDTSQISVSSANSLGEMISEEVEAQQKELEESSGNLIREVEMYDNIARVMFTAQESCTVVVGIYSEDEIRMYGCGVMEVDAEQTEIAVPINLDVMPEYYLVKAFLTDTETRAPISPAYYNDNYTKVMVEFFATEIGDFDVPESQLLVFDENKTVADNPYNFAVFSDSTVIFESDGTQNVLTNNGDDTYTVQNPSDGVAALQAGQTAAFRNVDGSFEFLKIAECTADSDTVILKKDELEPQEIFRFFRLEADGAMEQAEEPEAALPSRAGIRADDKDSEEDKGLPGEIYAQLELDPEFNIYIPEIDDDCPLDAKIIEKFHVKIAIDYFLSATYHFEGDLVDKKTPLGKYIYVVVPGIHITLQPCLNLTVEGEGELKFGISGTVGFDASKWNVQNLCTKPVIDFEGECQVRGFIGLALQPAVEMLHEEILSLAFEVEIGIELSATLEVSVHACPVCVDFSFGFVVNLEVELTFLKYLKLPAEITIPIPIGDAYWSSKLGFGWGECPYADLEPGTVPDDSGDNGDSSGDGSSGDGVTDAPRPHVYIPEKPDPNAISYHYIDEADGYEAYPAQPAEKICNANILSHIDGIPVKSIYFQDCPALSSICIPSTVESVYISNCEQLTSVNLSEGSCSDSVRIQYCHSLKAIDIPNSVSQLNQSSFSGLGALQSVTLPSNLEYLGHYVFEGCNVLTDIEIPDTIETIEPRCFSVCTALESVTIPMDAPLSKIDIGVFSYCKSLKTFIVPSNVTEIGMGAFMKCSSLYSIYFPPSVTVIGDYAFQNCDMLTSVKLPENLTEMGSYIFEDCDSLRYIEFPESATEIPNGMFMDCDGLRTLEIPSTISKIDTAAFKNCSSLHSIYFPPSVTVIGDSAFQNCDMLTSVKLPENLTKMGSSIFEDCDSLTSVTIPKSVTSISPDAFTECNYLTIYGYSGSEAESYAKNNGIPFVALDAEDDGEGSDDQAPDDDTPIQPDTPDKDEPEEITPITKTFTGLTPNTIYNFYVTEQVPDSETGEETILYITQGTADENGEWTVTYYPSAETEEEGFVVPFKAGDEGNAEDQTIPGDVNADGVLDISDAIFLARFVAEDSTLDMSNFNVQNADINGDGLTSAADTVYIIRKIAKLI